MTTKSELENSIRKFISNKDFVLFDSDFESFNKLKEAMKLDLSADKTVFGLIAAGVFDKSDFIIARNTREKDFAHIVSIFMMLYDNRFTFGEFSSILKRALDQHSINPESDLYKGIMNSEETYFMIDMLLSLTDFDGDSVLLSSIKK